MLEGAIRLPPGVAVTHYNLAYSFQKAGRLKQAIESYKQAIRLNPEFADAHKGLAIAYLQRGERSLALDEYALLKLIDYEQAQRLFALIYKDKILKVGSRQ